MAKKEMVKRKKAKQEYEELMDKIQKEVDQSNLSPKKKKKKPKKKVNITVHQVPYK